MNVRRPLTTPEAAQILGVSASTLRSWRKRGKGPSYVQPVPGAQPFYYPEVVELYRLQQRQAAEDRRRRSK